MQETNNNEFYYPENLTEKTTLFGWDWWAAAVIGLGIVISLIGIRVGLFIPLIVTAIFMIITFKIGDTSIYRQIGIAANYFLTEQMTYFWEKHENNPVPVFYHQLRKKEATNEQKEKRIRKHP